MKPRERIAETSGYAKKRARKFFSYTLIFLPLDSKKLPSIEKRLNRIFVLSIMGIGRR